MYALRLGAFSGKSLARQQRKIKVEKESQELRNDKTPSASSTDFVIETSIKDNVGIIKFDTPNSKVNVLTIKNGYAIMDVYKSLCGKNVDAIVLISKNPSCFISGADINMIKSTNTVIEAQKLSSDGQKVLNDIEHSRIPIVAAVSGHCIGGGLEVAMACHNIVALDNGKTQFGFPEVLLGLLPGAGGTVRSFERLNYQDALSMIMTGKMLKPHQAQRVGIVHQVVKAVGPGIKNAEENSMDLLEQVAVAHAKKLKNTDFKNRIVTKKTFLSPVLDPVKKFFNPYLYSSALWFAEKQTTLKTKGKFPAPYKIVEILREFNTGKLSRNEMFALEAKAFAELSKTPECAKLMSIYFNRTSIQKQNHGKPQKTVNNIGIIGSGLMGSGIAEVSALKGNFNVMMVDISDKMLKSAHNSIANSLNRLIKRKSISNFKKDLILTHIDYSTDLNAISNVELVIEAATEDLSVKQKILKQFESMCGPKAIFATNTSALELKQIISESSRPENIVGMHYFSPVPKMELLEVVKHNKISQNTLATAVDVGRRQGKLCVVVNDCPGFYTTRILFAALSEIISLFNEGVSPITIDEQTTDFGFVYGSASLIDQVGVDVSHHISHYLCKEYVDRFGHVDLTILDKLTEKKMFGAKTKRGIYIYPNYKSLLQSAQNSLKMISNINARLYPQINPEFTKLCKNKQNISIEDVKTRIVSKFINECVLCLQEGVLSSPSDGDIAAIFGLGFPPALGGPFQFLDSYGCDKIVKGMEEMNKKYKRKDFVPCDLLKKHAAEKTKFYNN